MGGIYYYHTFLNLYIYHVFTGEITWTNSYNPNAASSLTIKPPVVLDVTQEFVESDVMGCYAQAFAPNSPNTVVCQDVTSHGVLYFNFGNFMFHFFFLPHFHFYLID